MTLQVLGVQVRLGAVRARELAICVLDRDNRVLRGRGTGGGSSRTTGGAGQDAAAALGTNNVSGLVVFTKDTVLRHHRARTVGRADAVLAHEATRRHGAQDRRTAAARRSGRDGLRVRGSRGGTGHHGLGGTVAGVRRVGVLSHRVHAAASAGLGALRVAGRQVVRRVWRVRRSGARRVRVATIKTLLHAGGGGLQRRQRLGERRTWLTVMRRKGRWRRVAVRVRGSVYTIGGIRRVIHAIARKKTRRGRRFEEVVVGGDGSRG